MRKITLRLTEAEYFALEQRARTERRSVREMAEYLVVQPQPLALISPYVNPNPTLIPPYIVTNKGTTSAPWLGTTYESGTTCSAPNDAH